MASQNSANATGSGHQSLTSSSSTNAATAIPTSTSFPHKKVLVLLLCWEDEQDGVWGEIIRLETVLNIRYKFETDFYRIPLRIQTPTSWRSSRRSRRRRRWRRAWSSCTMAVMDG
ncbi:hypothetical protein DL95DRAFT_390752 [Leptodontidium sp. 2 PMI_412]|nr:hypothetical protein BKA61DRAFT_582247 [Leptodontidium sp. MPI-SDFR-AT-0119]KAH9213164.1 hypothetical protein DL95DRAFT_390752 [Leptodontidium sp. 2 PMI_412]